MSVLDLFNFNFSIGFGKKQQYQSEESTNEEEKEIKILNEAFEKFQSREIEGPILSGRQSVPEGIDLIPGSFSPVNVQFPFELYKILENLAIYNGHVGQAIENIVTLANTDVETYFSDEVSQSQQRKMKDHLKRKRNSWYEHSEGENSLINDLLTQIAIYGCLSAESVVKKDLSGIDKIVKVNPYNVRFVYDKDSGIYIPVQKIPHNIVGNVSLNSRYPGYVELNKNTYQYIAIRRIGSNPYPIPPFFAALEALVLERDNLDGFRNMVKKLGVLGFLSVLVTAPKKSPGENDNAYFQRCLNHLDDLRPQVEKGYSTGVALGFKGKHEFNVEGNNMNVQGADGIFKISKSYIFSGVKQDPNMMGENYSVTETFGRVILAKTTKQMENYQKIVASYLAQVEYLELILAGFKPGYVEKRFAQAMIGDRKREEETEKIRIENVIRKRDEGIIDQQMSANELGYDKPAAPGRINQSMGNSGVEDEEGGPDNPTPENNEEQKEEESSNVRIIDFAKLINGFRKGDEYDYYIPEVDGHRTSFIKNNSVPQLNSNGEEISFVDFPDKKLMKFSKDYTKSIVKIKNDTIELAEKEINKALKNLSKDDGVDTIRQTVLFHLLRIWNSEFRIKIKSVVDDNVSEVYEHYRKDTKVFEDSPGFSAGRKFMKEKGVKFDSNQTCYSLQRREESIKMFTVPDATFDLLDFRAIEYMSSLDKVYLGKYITDTDTQRRLTRWIEERYLKEGNPLNSNKEISKFVDDFGDKVDLESWKINRIIDTTVNKAKNIANVNYIKQSGLAEFEVVEVMDRLTCEWCSFMNGQRFSVDKAVDKFDNAIDGGVEDVSNSTPFATSVKIDEFKEMTAEDLQNSGFDAPVYHPKCRGRCVAVI